ncbi:MAG: hypothetical protein RDV48_02955 [Candidatus Eremiobacteraeota bacterium]|nr:hypothetical protein [Candidatus Eremiobacteraeota bacterium]
MPHVKKVILYKHGVGYFEKRMTIRDKAAVDLSFKTREMNDVLKSLTIMDLGGGIVSSVSYDSTTPTEKLLEDISIRIPEERSLTSLLSQIKGARIELHVGKEILQGAVVGLDPLTRKEQDTIIETQRLTILNDRGEMTSFPLEEIKSIRIADESINRDLEFYLKTIIFKQKKDLKKLTIFTSGEGERELLVSYVLESPVWKTTYRVVLGAGKKPLIQGWAVVDNTQDEDWDEIALSLVSGLPVSFVHDLYHPRFKRRPVVEVRDEAGVAPPSFEEGFAEPAPSAPMEMDMEEAAIMPRKREMKAKGDQAMLFAGGAPGAPAPARAQMASSVEVKTITAKVGDFFEYRIAHPVTIKRNQSALVPIIHGHFKGEKILVYNERNRAHNPMTCLEMTNDTGLTLEGGPVTVYEQDTYMGESMLDFTKPDEKKFIPYAVDLGCHIEKMEFFNDEPVFLVNIAGGVMNTHYYRKREKIYKIKYKSAEAVKLIIEHPREVDWELVDTPAPIETTQSFYRFLMDLPAAGEYTFPVKDKRIFWTTYNLMNLSNDAIMYFLSQKFYDSDTAEEIQRLNGLQIKKQDMEREIALRRAELQSIFNDQERLRNNIQSLSSSREETALRERLIGKMTEQENLIETLERTIKSLQEDIEKAQKEINQFLVTLQREIKVEEQHPR